MSVVNRLGSLLVILVSGVLFAAPTVAGSAPAAAGVEETAATLPVASTQGETSEDETDAPPAPRPQRIVAIGDIHGEWDGLIALLQSAELVDDNLDWIGGTAKLVQTGDVFDRGTAVFRILDLLMKLEQQAAAVGGEVVALMGNHEAMNLLGFRSDVHPDLYAEFATPEVLELQDERLREYRVWQAQRAKVRKEQRPRFDKDQEREWNRQYPAGTYEYIEAIAPGSRYGEWLRARPMVAQVGDFIFLHGGLAEDYVRSSIAGLNEAARDEIAYLDACRQRLLAEQVVHALSDPSEMVREGVAQLTRVRKQLGKKQPPAEMERLRDLEEVLGRCVDYEQWFLVKEDSPVWFRGYARWSEEEATDLVQRGLAKHHARAFVVGHTPRKSGEIEERFDGRVYLIDTGMLESVYQGRASALEIVTDAIDDRAGTVRALYVDEAADLRQIREIPRVPPPGRIFRDVEGQPLPFTNDDQILDFLSRAKITPLGTTAKGTNKPIKLELELDGLRTWAIFRDVDIVKERFRDKKGRFYPRFKDSYRFEVAAYEVDRTLGLGHVPPVVLRRWDNREGTIQIWVQNVIDEEDRRKEGLQAPDPVALAHQNIMRRWFDNLIANFDRNLGNILIDKETWRLWLIDHTRSFVEKDHLANPEEVNQCDRDVWYRFRDTDLEALAERLDVALTRGEIKTFKIRWQKVRERIEQRIEELGEMTVLFDARM